MIARVLDIPDDEAATAAWLDEQLVADGLHELVAELAAVHDVATPVGVPSSAEAAAWLGDSLPGLLERGTAALDPPRFQALLRTPGLLPAIQELVFVDGGDHWSGVMRRTVAPADASDRGATNGGPLPTVRPPAAPAAGGRPSRFATGAALAAGLLLALATWSILRPGPAAPWGWNRPDVFAAAGAPEYLENLATAAGEWSATVPESEAALARRLDELLAGCDRLIEAAHAPLTPADRAWLVERCAAWREKVVGHAAALAASHDVQAVREAADSTVEKLIAALRSRAQEIRGRETAA